MWRTGRSMVGLIVFSVLATSAAQGLQRGADLGAVTPSDTALVRRTKEDMLAAHNERVQSLIDVIEDEDFLWNWPSTVMAAVEVLGEMRAVEASERLVAIIGYPAIRPPGGPPVRQFIHRTPWPTPWWSPPDERTVADALLRVGRPSLPAVVEKLGETSNPVEIEACLQVLFFLTGREGAESALRAASVGKDGAPAARLAKALGMLKDAPAEPSVPPRLRVYLPSVVPKAGGD